MKTPATHSHTGIALAWLQLKGSGVVSAAMDNAQVTVLEPVNLSGPLAYFLRTPNPGNAADMGNSSGTRLTSFSASSYST